MQRLDAHTINQAANFFSRELEQKLPKIWEQQYANLWAENGLYLPAPSVLEEGTTSISEEVMESVGRAQEISDLTDDIPTVSVSIAEAQFKVHHFALAYHYSILELAREAKAGRSLQTQRIKAVDRGLRQRVNDLLLFGDKKRGSQGLYNLNGIPLSATAYNPNTATWVQHIDFFVNLLGGVQDRNQLSAGISYVMTSYKHTLKLKTTYQSNDSGKTAYDAIMDIFGTQAGGTLKGIIGVNESKAAILEAKGIKAAGTNLDRIVCMPQDSEVLSYARFAPNYLEPERRSMNFKVAAYVGCSELIVHEPEAMQYADIPTVL
jgi:hypothetical protein